SICADDGLEHIRSFAHGSHRETTAKDRLSGLAHQMTEETSFPVRAIRKTETRQEDTDAIIRLGSTREFEKGRMVAGQCTRHKQISLARFTKQVSVGDAGIRVVVRLDRDLTLITQPKRQSHVRAEPPTILTKYTPLRRMRTTD